MHSIFSLNFALLWKKIPLHFQIPEKILHIQDYVLFISLLLSTILIIQVDLTYKFANMIWCIKQYVASLWYWGNYCILKVQNRIGSSDLLIRNRQLEILVVSTSLNNWQEIPFDNWRAVQFKKDLSTCLLLFLTSEHSLIPPFFNGIYASMMRPKSFLFQIRHIEFVVFWVSIQKDIYFIYLVFLERVLTLMI